MDLVATYADHDAVQVTPTIISILPGAASDGARIRVGGEWLSGGRSVRRSAGGEVYFDHRPIPVEVVKWTDKEVKIRLPNDISRSASITSGSSTIWLSLAVNGKETNALPLQLSTSPASNSSKS
jgi:hypothetical protein